MMDHMLFCENEMLLNMGSFLSPVYDYTLAFEDSNSYFLHFDVNMKRHLSQLFVE